MRTNFLSAIISLPFLLPAQVVNQASHTGYQKSSEMVSVNQKSYYLEIMNFTELNLHCIDIKGEVIFSKSLAYLPWCEKTSITVTSDKQLFVTGGTAMEGCDYGFEKLYFIKLDTNGVVSGSTSITGDVKAWTNEPSGKLLVYMNDELSRYDMNGNLIGSLPLYLVNHNPWAEMKMLMLGSDNLIVSYSSGSSGRLRKANLNGTSIIEVQTSAVYSQIKEGTDSSIYGLANGYITKFSPQLAQLHNSALLSQSGGIKVFTVHNDTILAAGENAQHELYYIVLDSSLNLVHYAKSNIEHSSPTGISIIGNKTHLVTTGLTASVQGQSFTGWFQTSKTGTLESTEDAGIVDLSMDQVTRLNSSPPMAFVSGATVTVKNFSHDTLKKVVLNSYAYVSWPCYLLIGLQKPVTLSLPPNGTAAISTGTFYADMSGSGNETRICIFTSIPNGMNDENVENDAACMSVIPLSLETLEINAEINLFPNPADDYVNIVSAVQIEFVAIINSLGQTERTITLRGQKGFPTESLTPGIYLLHLRSENGNAFRRIVIDR